MCIICSENWKSNNLFQLSLFLELSQITKKHPWWKKRITTFLVVRCEQGIIDCNRLQSLMLSSMLKEALKCFSYFFNRKTATTFRNRKIRCYCYCSIWITKVGLGFYESYIVRLNMFPFWCLKKVMAKGDTKVCVKIFLNL